MQNSDDVDRLFADFVENRMASNMKTAERRASFLCSNTWVFCEAAHCCLQDIAIFFKLPLTPCFKGVLKNVVDILLCKRGDDQVKFVGGHQGLAFYRLRNSSVRVLCFLL